MTMYVPAVGEMVQDIIGHWYRIVEVRAGGWRYLVDQLHEVNGTLYSYGYAPLLMGRSEFKFGN
jgi:hypothetical protein